MMYTRRVLVIGGAGFFGRLLVDDLRQHVDCEVIVASRPHARSHLFAGMFDPRSPEPALQGVRRAICAAGPYQELPLSLVELCVIRGIHYIDLSDHRGFVHQLRSSIAAHQNVNTAVCTAWSTVSALSGMLVQIASDGLAPIDSIRI